MIKRLLLVCFIVLITGKVNAQTYGNEWINYSQFYYKIKIAQNGVYRIDSTTLADAGIPLVSINPKNFQIFNKGVQQYIHIEGESDNVFNGSDFIEFYAEKNDGALDSLLYINSSFVPNPYYSLINDTSVYFLTWNASLVNNRMSEDTASDYSSYLPDAYFFKDAVSEFHSGYFEGQTDNVGGTDSRYTKSEGWFDANVITLGATGNYGLNTPNIYAGGPNAKFRAVVLGASKNAAILLDHELQIYCNGNLLKDTSFFGYEAMRFTYGISPSFLLGTGNSIQFTSVNAGFVSNRTVVSYINVKYPHTTNMEGANNFMIYVPENAGQLKTFYQLSNFSSTGVLHCYDLSNAKRIAVRSDGVTDSVLIPNSGGEKKCFITSDGFISPVISLLPVGVSGQFTDYASTPIDSAYIIVTHKTLTASALDYKVYRGSAPGGFHNVLIADIDQLYDQYAYGIVKSPLSIRGFSNHLLNSFPTPPKNLFLLGKSYHMIIARQDPLYYPLDLLPSFGNPSSDNLFTAGLSGGVVVPAIPTGRLAARNNVEVNDYLGKVQSYESQAPAEWMKQVLHFGGGSTSTEQASFSAFLNGYKATIEDSLFGGHVTNFLKTSTAPIDINTSDTLEQFMNDGVSLMTFFGHASGTGFDLSIDDIDSYNPLPGHYPFMIANGCYSGDLHSTELTTSEEYVLKANKGMIGYLASVSLGVPYALNIYSTELYKQISLSNYGNSIGSSVKNTIAMTESAALLDPIMMSTENEMTLHGDPAMIINSHKKPDYKITNNDVYFDLTQTNPLLDSIIIYAVRTNLGRATNDTIFTQAYRTFPDGGTQTYYVFTPAPKFKDTVAIKVPWDFSRDIGLNKVRITLDYFNRVDELSETNNVTTDVNFIINGGDVVPVYPYEFAIIPKDTVTLKASTSDVFAALRNYKFQIDTTDTFNSPLMQDTLFSSIGGVLKWKPSMNFSPLTVYYWRVSPDSTSASSGYKWRESSFQYIPGKRGWEQAHFFQFKKDGYEYVKFNRPLRRFDFVNDLKSLQCNNGMMGYVGWFNINYKINGSLEYVSGWALPGFTIAAFDPVSNTSMKSIALGPGLGVSDHGSVTYAPAGTPENAFDFYDSDSLNRAKITNFILNDIPNGYRVLAYSQENHSIPSYEESLYRAFDSIGSTQIRTVPAMRSYILFGTKGVPGSATEVIASSVDSAIQFNTTLVSNWNQGSISSPIIGPALTWDSLSWKQHHIDGISTDDTVYVKLIGIMADGSEDTLADFTSSQLDIPNLSTYANAANYPYLRMVAYMKDDTLNTPPQMERWQIIYTPVPEAAINPIIGYYEKDSVQEGDNIVVRLPIQNISEYTFADSLLVTYWVEDANNVNHPLPSKLKKNLFAPDEVIIDTITLNTAGYPGLNALWVEVNPVHPMNVVDTSKTQLEQYHFNNIVRISFNTTTDNINPLLDVTFDGIHILNSDIVSSKPNILIQLKDENQFLALNDTADFKVFIQYPSSSIAQRIYFGSELSFTPAVLPNNSCKLNYTPALYEDGKYQLLVQATDKTDNQSGAIDYKIHFEVVNKSTITEIMNYPNPFSTATHFVFTLTGSEVPTYFKIQILTITGKVIREITNDELGMLHVGRNITDYAWDGKDEFGDQLANGVYLYRVVTTLRGEDIEKRESGADQYFKKGFGKMYLIR